jgi:large subunit ribosomal protein L4
VEIKILNIKGNNTGKKLFLDDSIFNIQNPNQYAIYLEIKRYLAAQRHGKHKTKERSEISGSTRKIHRQKGTGSSRKGDIKNPLFRGGARVFGPSLEKNYKFKINKFTRILARKSILTIKNRNNQIKIVENFFLKIPKTKLLLEIIKSLNILNKKSLIISENINKNLYLSSRNLKMVKVVSINEVNNYDLLNFFYIVFIENSIKKLEKIMMK